MSKIIFLSMSMPSESRNTLTFFKVKRPMFSGFENVAAKTVNLPRLKAVNKCKNGISPWLSPLRAKASLDFKPVEALF